MIIVNITIVLSLVHMTLAEDNRLLHLPSSSGTQMLSIHSDQTFYPASIYDLPMGDMGKKSMPCYIPEESLEKRWEEKEPQNAWRVRHTGVVQVAPHLHSILVGLVL